MAEIFNQRYIQLNDGMKIPTVGFGTWQIPNDKASETVAHALSSGYRHIDTAAIYENEEGVGLGVKESGLKREEIFLTTKVWNSDHGYDQALRAMDKSLARLKTDYVDLYLIHWRKVNSDKYIPTWKALNRLRQEGLARSIGVSNFNIEHLENLMQETGVVPAINQIELHPYFQQKELQAFHQKHGIITEGWSPLARGKFLEDAIFLELAKKYGKSVSQVVLRWHFESGILAIPKTMSATRMLENLNIFDFNLTASDFELINSLDKKRGANGPLTRSPPTFRYGCDDSGKTLSIFPFEDCVQLRKHVALGKKRS